MSYHAEYQRAQTAPLEYWEEQAQHLHWDAPWEQVLDSTNAPFDRWFPGAKINTCYNALDRHVENGRADQAALIYDSPVTASKRQFSYRELRDEVAKLAGALVELGVGKGDRVVIYMPMVPQAAMAMLACARIGAIHSVVFGGFAATELAKRIDAAAPKLLMSASCGIEPGRTIAYKPLLDEALKIAEHPVENCLILQRPQCQAALQDGRDHDWQTASAKATPADCVSLLSTDPLYVLYTSGTTGKPKGVVRDNGGHAVAMHYSMRAVYRAKPGEVYWAASDVGWVVGHSYIVYAPLLMGCTTVMYEGKPVGTPDAGAFWRMIDEYKISTLFTAPTAFRAIKKEDPQGRLLADYDISSLKTLYLAGERSDPDTIVWAQDQLKVPVIDHWWQTELGWPAIANCLGLQELAVKPGSSSVPVPGYEFAVLDEQGQVLADNSIGNLAIRLPLPPGTLLTLWDNDDGYQENYLARYPGYYLTGDAGFRDDDGYISIMSRIDDIINVAGHRLSTGGMEEVLAAHPAVAECAVIGVADTLKGQLPLGLVVLKTGVEQSDKALCLELIASVRESIGAVAAFKLVAVVPRLPKTRSGKVLRACMRKLADGENPAVPATIDDPNILDEIAQALKQLGYPVSD
ncbi:MAG: propionyl-CoA synthetase [Oceanococcus sp.]